MKPCVMNALRNRADILGRHERACLRRRKVARRAGLLLRYRARARRTTHRDTYTRTHMTYLVDEEITFRKLEILLVFMETGNLARAAERLDISTVSVHRALHSLETGARCALFRLEGRNLLPTDAAKALAD